MTDEEREKLLAEFKADYDRYHRQLRSAKHKQWRDRNRDRVTEYDRAYRAIHADRINALRRERKAKKKEVT